MTAAAKLLTHSPTRGNCGHRLESILLGENGLRKANLRPKSALSSRCRRAGVIREADILQVGR
jgi:hypothetical protein